MAHSSSGTGDGLVLGGDIGGTSTRLVVADGAGRVLTRGTGPGGNPVAHPATARQVLAETLARALDGVDPAAVRAGVIGMAGSGAARDPAARAAYDELWRQAGLGCRPKICSDLEVAYAAGTDAASGTVLVAGTGAVAGRIRDRRLVAAVGGHGWLLGDEGSGYWIGREAVRVALRVLEGTALDGVLARSVLDRFGIDARDAEARSALIATVHGRPPVALAAVAPLVSAAHEAGDPAATAVLDEAASHLLRTWDGLGVADPGAPVVLAGALATAGTHLGELVRAGLHDRGAAPVTAADPVLGAVRLALGSERSPVTREGN
ncbi:N-acetylglucosamine kinase [Nocardioides coralli]|uniref:N-acetylglucosamine kinase n=1 Tax=Nocardioides coralli TaxID=2872154 RepID=UPI001CA3BDE5|nr:BadF/BadG/BcrA/BcrD ATPase family protein [Nocardioides coralli]QZY28596.1 ATPase [Nocardioides coralli]